MINLADFVSRLKQVIAWHLDLSQESVYLSERTGWNHIDQYRQILRGALIKRDTQILSVKSASNSFLELGRIFCVEINDYTVSWDDDWFKNEAGLPPVDTWFALDEFPKDHEAILYCWIPKAFEKQTEQEVLSGYFWRDKRANMFYNSVLLAMAEPVN
ncbi:MAG: hypothetical protein ACRYF0_09325 [Janthinobacterium lividum]